MNKPYVVALDSSNEVIALGLGRLDSEARQVELVESFQMAAHRASNTQLVNQLDALCKRHGVERDGIACIVASRGPGSFTGVRIGLATAKGLAQGLECPLVGTSSLEAVAWQAASAGYRGDVWVVADAMRKELYPLHCYIDEAGQVELLSSWRVNKAQVVAEEIKTAAQDGTTDKVFLAGDGLAKYADLFDAEYFELIDEALWQPSGEGLLSAFGCAWKRGLIDINDKQACAPGNLLPIYTRLSDAEENERIRLAKNDPKSLVSGVSEEGLRKDQRACANDSVIANSKADERGLLLRPLDAAHVEDVERLEAKLMGSDAWSAALIADDITRPDRIWWAAYVSADTDKQLNEADELIGYVGVWVVDGQMQVLKIAVSDSWQGSGVALALLGKASHDARDLGASSTSLEVRASNERAQHFYTKVGLSCVGKRPKYYSDKEDACIFEGPLFLDARSVAGMDLQVNALSDEDVINSKDAASGCVALTRPLILAIESSCDETACAIIDGTGVLLSDVVASQIDFHARFGGVVPEIASRKHIEAICGVVDECFDRTAAQLGKPSFKAADLDAIAVTTSPGLVGALVVGLAFAKGLAWAANKPLIGVNHLEGHLYANKIESPDLTPPAVVSLVSGGHTMLVHVKDWGNYETLGSTIDDAVGEAFDKVAKALGLGYPGGPIISKLAAQGNPDAIAFPRALMHSHDLRFSLSGLKTAVMTYINKEQEAKRPLNLADIAASFQQAVIDVQIKKAKQALLETEAKEFCLGGGVAANPALRQAYEKLCDELEVRLTLPPLSACTDNAGMIALVAYDLYQSGCFIGFDADAQAQGPLDAIKRL